MYLVEEIKNGIYWMGCNDFRTELFERIFPIPEGVSYNSYFIDDEKTCVIDAMDKSCRDEFLEDVEHLLNGRPLDYFILQHMEPIMQVQRWHCWKNIRLQKSSVRHRRLSF